MSVVAGRRMPRTTQVRIIYADVQYDPPGSGAFRVVELRDQNGTDLTRHIDPTKRYNSTLEVGVDLAKKLGGKVRVEITGD